ncbi:hypothetical protein [Thalassobaculum litoreum]|uniref:Uncharacterized protein n=1 Tax=Thalassobaculum litoreum DSM 18839 TaxID=1123362 RepID=A0A8G2BHE1_9PROT|nr:hypothetical protein [Thalassobaculum litoreum]SDF73647.1 hypothetical protein SAMN05660686_02125 [Thalassobaculum litoreum DSM 18839]
MDLMDKESNRKKAAHDFVERVVRGIYHQNTDEDTIRAVAERVEQATPRLEAIS